MNFLYLLLLLVATGFTAWHTWRRLRYFLHVFQLEGYKPHEYFPWLRTHGRKRIGSWQYSLGAGLLLALFAGLREWPQSTLLGSVALLAWTVTFASSRPYVQQREKKPLAYTSRMQRLLATAAALTLLPIAAGIWFYGTLLPTVTLGFYLLGWFIADLGAPLWVLLAGYLMQPVEHAIHEGFKRQARAKLAQHPHLTVVGITGSFGKTSTKHIASDILSQKYHVLATPGSYNTPMGICKVINNRLEDHHQILLLEMGARYTGDIQELCEIARPDIAVVTSVGPAHLETFGSIKNIARTKSEIIKHMKDGGTAVLNADNPHVRQMAELSSGPVWQVSREGQPAEITGSNLQYSTSGSSFTVQDETKASFSFETQLLGAHNMLNILLGVAVGRVMGLRLRQIAHAVRRIQPVEHRLQLRKQGEITVIDDAFNANPVGARSAVEILGAFQTGRRVIVTPGMIELGERQAEENRKFGEHIGKHVDLAVLIGEQQTRPIREGLCASGFPDDQVKTFASLFDAQDFLSNHLSPGDTVLYENDLPDQYNESAA